MRAARAVNLTLVHAVVAALAGLTLVPLAWLVLASFKRPADFFEGGLFNVDPGRLTLANYERLLVDLDLWVPLLNSVFLSAVTSVLAVLVCAAGGYALAVYRFRGRAAMHVVVLGALLIPPPLLLAPGYQWLYELGLLNSYAGVILPAIAPAFGVFLFRQASLRSVPLDLVEAARIDGCPELLIFVRIGLPLLRPMIGAFTIITFLAMWNNFIMPQVVLQDLDKQPLSVVIAQLRDVYYQDYGLIMAGTVLSVIPVMALFLFLQRDFIDGLTSGAVKG